MAVRFMPFAHWSPKWGAAATMAGAAGLATLALTGQGQTALALLAAGGAAGAALFGAGKLHVGGEESRLDARLQQVLGVLPSAVAVTNRKGKVLWRSEALLKLLAGSGAARDSVAARRRPARGGSGDLPAVPGRPRGSGTRRDPRGSANGGRRVRSCDGDALAG